MRLGILGAGQLGRMLALAAIPRGITPVFFDRKESESAKPFAEVHELNFADPSEAERIAAECDVFTFEFENIPEAFVRALQAHAPVMPGCRALEVCSDRLNEKEFLQKLRIPCAPYIHPKSRDEIESFLIDGAAILKTRKFGYDGKNQHVLHSAADIPRITDFSNYVLERKIPFQRELSIIGVMSQEGILYYPLAENVHRSGILWRSRIPAPQSDGLQEHARDYLGRIFKALEYRGVCALELFEVQGRLVANEIAPRVHNSGHWSVDGCDISQFEAHIRAVCGLPLTSLGLSRPSIMQNIIGEMPQDSALYAHPNFYPHLYGKSVRDGRKLGHINVLVQGDGGEEERLLSKLFD